MRAASGGNESAKRPPFSFSNGQSELKASIRAFSASDYPAGTAPYRVSRL